MPETQKKESGEAREAVLEDLHLLRTRILKLKEESQEQEDKIESLKKELASFRPVNGCWWDGEVCQIYPEIRGLQDFGALCRECHRLDGERFLFAVEETKLIEDQINEAADEAAKEGREEGEAAAWEEISREIEEIKLGIGIEGIRIE